MLFTKGSGPFFRPFFFSVEKALFLGFNGRSGVFGSLIEKKKKTSRNSRPSLTQSQRFFDVKAVNVSPLQAFFEHVSSSQKSSPRFKMSEILQRALALGTGGSGSAQHTGEAGVQRGFSHRECKKP